MSKVLVLYYSTYGHIETMAQAVAEGARSAGATVDVKRVPETVPDELARKSGYKMDQAAPIAITADTRVRVISNSRAEPKSAAFWALDSAMKPLLSSTISFRSAICALTLAAPCSAL